MSTTSSTTEMAGRLGIQAEAERRIVRDIAAKLELSPGDRLLEIGCGVGNLLIPLSFEVAAATGIDDETVVGFARSRLSGGDLRYIGGRFPEITFDERFDKILVYSVLHYLKGQAELFAFVDRALSLLDDAGMMLLGDIPGTGRKARFLASRKGRIFTEQWQRQVESNASAPQPRLEGPFIDFSDDTVMALLLHVRERGYHSYILPQLPDLPFGHTREDILIVGPEH